MKKFFMCSHEYFPRKKNRLLGSWNTKYISKYDRTLAVPIKQKRSSWILCLKVSNPSKKDLFNSTMMHIIKQLYLFLWGTVYFFPFLKYLPYLVTSQVPSLLLHHVSCALRNTVFEGTKFFKDYNYAMFYPLRLLARYSLDYWINRVAFGRWRYDLFWKIAL